MLLFQSAVLYALYAQGGLPWANICCSFRALVIS